ncbi:MAG: FAD-dependent oxidoreductase [Chlorobiaceae bacterium]|nr:FAD-dependent oxidoreductase [Chlorobiaceae bacterium]
MSISRRDFNKLLLSGVAGSAFGLFGMNSKTFASGAARKHVVVVGGGFGGAATAKYLRKLDPSLSVTLIEQKLSYVTCPFSNWVIGGLKNIKDITHTYTALRTRHGINVIADRVVSIDAPKGQLKLASGKMIGYDRLVVAPGIDFKYEAVPGYSQKIAETKIPHAWQAGAQTLLLQRQLHGMKNGSDVIICAPDNPFRCPPGPYERASLIAHYLKKHKPQSKVIILDAKEKFSKQGLFTKGWERLYPGKIAWHSSTGGGKVLGVNAENMSVETEFGAIKGGVINVIPPQKAGKIAFDTGLTNEKGWCPVHPSSFESTILKGIHVVGDACVAGAMPKSGFAASSQGKVAAAAIINLLNGKEPAPPSLVNTCYSLIGPEYGISVAGVYQFAAAGIVEIPGSGGLTPLDASDDQLQQEALFAEGWYTNISKDIWG